MSCDEGVSTATSCPSWDDAGWRTLRSVTLSSRAYLLPFSCLRRTPLRLPDQAVCLCINYGSLRLALHPVLLGLSVSDHKLMHCEVPAKPDLTLEDNEGTMDHERY
jgi:hypothetical protein